MLLFVLLDGVAGQARVGLAEHVTPVASGVARVDHGLLEVGPGKLTADLAQAAFETADDLESSLLILLSPGSRHDSILSLVVVVHTTVEYNLILCILSIIFVPTLANINILC